MMSPIRNVLALAPAAALAAMLTAAPATAQVTRVSVATDGSEANAPSVRSVISGNGQVVAFTSLASNLVAGDTNDVLDVFVRDLAAHTTTRVSVASDGTQRAGASGALVDAPDALAISDDGNIIAFSSVANLAADDTNQCPSSSPNVLQPCSDIYVHDRTTGTTTRVSVATDGTQGDGQSYSPSLSADGRYVVFSSTSSNLVAGDTNGINDIFLHDRTSHTTTRVNVAQGGAQGSQDSWRGVISADGSTVAFISGVTSFGDAPIDSAITTAIYVRTLANGAVRRLLPGGTPASVQPLTPVQWALSADGKRLIAIETYWRRLSMSMFSTGYVVERFEVPTGARLAIALVELASLSVPLNKGLGITADGRTAAYSNQSSYSPDSGPLTVADADLGLTDATIAGDWPSLSSDGRFLVFASNKADLVTGDSNAELDIFLMDRDPDGDGLPTTWETRFGLNPNDATDAGADPDSDGRTNLQEYQAGTHPKGTQTRYFAEGAAGTFFNTRFAVANPNATPATVMLRALGANGTERTFIRTVPANARDTFYFTPDGYLHDLTSELPDTVFSSVIESDQPIVADRLMGWGTSYGGWGSSLETSVDAPGTTWYLAEGASGTPYSLYYLLQNPGNTDAQATATYLLPSPHAPIVKTYDVPAHTRLTIDVTGEDPALKHAEVSAKITATQPIVVERALYYSTPARFAEAGHAGAAVPAPAKRWFFAEGATGFFDEYIPIVNAEGMPAHIKATYLLEGSAAFSEEFDVPANSRYTLDLKARDARLLSAAVSVIIESTNDVPVVAERVMWWPHPSWYEASLSAGVTGTGTKWAMAEGQQRSEVYGAGSIYISTYVLIANTDPAIDGSATVTLLFTDGTTAQKTVPLPASRRITVDIGHDFKTEAANKLFSIIVESNGVPIVVERSLYQTLSGDVLWGAGATSVATNITPVP